MEFQLDTPAVRALRDHLLRMSRDSIPPGIGVTAAMERSPEEEEVLRRFAPFAALLYLVASIDGITDESERAVILGAFRTLTGGRVSSQRLTSLERNIRGRIAESNVEDLLEAVASDLALNRDDAELAFTLAAAVVLADDAVAGSEQGLLDQLGSWLGVRQGRASELLRGAS